MPPSPPPPSPWSSVRLSVSVSLVAQAATDADLQSPLDHSLELLRDQSGRLDLEFDKLTTTHLLLPPAPPASDSNSADVEDGVAPSSADVGETDERHSAKNSRLCSVVYLAWLESSLAAGEPLATSDPSLVLHDATAFLHK
jgi:hypothetical protein